MIELLKKNAKWISSDDRSSEYLVRQNFNTADIKEAKIIFGVFGTYEAYINGRRIGDSYYLPLASDFHKRDDLILGKTACTEEYTHRIYCTVFDITALLCSGSNTLSVSMAGGIYGTGTMWGRPNTVGAYGKSKLSYAIKLVDTNDTVSYVFSNEDAKWKKSFITEYNFYCGEVHNYLDYDANWNEKDYDDSAWVKVSIENPPKTQMCNQGNYPSDKIVKRLIPRLIEEKNGRKLYDCGHVISGVVRVKALDDDSDITIYYDERLNDEGRPFVLEDEWYGYTQYSKFNNCRKNQMLNTIHTWHCFRYFELSGNAEVVDALVINSDVGVTSSFKCNNEILNWLYDAFVNTMLCNMHTCVPMDCPHIERKGYTGDGHLSAVPAMRILDCKDFYRKWLIDISDAQDKITGAMQYTAPFHNAGGGPCSFGVAIAVVPYQYYKHYGDADVAYEFYPKILKWFSFLETQCENELVVKDRPGLECLGEWSVPAGRPLGKDGLVLAPEFVNTYYYIKALEIAYEFEDVLSIDHSTQNLKNTIEIKKNALKTRFFDEATGDYFSNLQGANAFAVDIGIGDERTFENLVSYYKTTGCYDTGIFGTDVLTRVLFENGESALAISLLTSKNDISYHTMMQSGLLTIWETWKGFRSHCHPMFGSVTKYLFDHVLGIAQLPGSCAYRKIKISPQCRDIISEAKGKITTPQGEIKVEYNKNHISVYIPQDTSATLVLDEKEFSLSCGENYICFD